MFDFVAHADVDGWRLTVSEAMAADLAAAVATADVWWLTSWREQAPELVGPLLGLPEWNWASYTDRKVDAIVAMIHDRSRPFVWIDDEISVADRLTLEDLDSDQPLVAPTPRTGLRPSQVAAVADWVAARC